MIGSLNMWNCLHGKEEQVRQWWLNSSLLLTKCSGWSVSWSPCSRVGTQLWCVFYSHRSPRPLSLLQFFFRPPPPSSDTSKDKHIMWPLIRAANRFHILYRWIIFCFNHLCDSRGHDPRSRWVATSPETSPCLVCRERRRMSDEALMCCAVCLTACLLVFHTFSLVVVVVVCLLCHYSSAPSWWISWPFSANPAWLYVQWNESLLEI